jgi:PAS domain S-box-containing protein
MPADLVQISLNSTATIVIAFVVLVLAVAVLAFLFVRSGVQRRSREPRVRERLLEMEREAQFASAAGLVPISRQPAEVAANIAGLLREYLSLQVVAVYAAHATEATLSNVSGENEAASQSLLVTLPPSVPTSLLTENPWPVVVNVATIAARESSNSSATEVPARDQSNQPTEESPTENSLESPHESSPQSATDIPAEIDSENPGETALTSPAEDTAVDNGEHSQKRTDVANSETRFQRTEEVMLLPWHGPFRWNGLIVTAVPPGMTVDALDPYREPLALLTDRLAVALEFEVGDAAIEAFDERASRTTEFSRSLVSCLEEAAPLEAIVREVTRLMSGDSGALWRVDEASGMVRMVAAHGLSSPEFLPLPVGQGLAGTIAQNGETLALEEAPADPRCIFPREARESGIIGYLGAALTADARTLGVIEVHSVSRRSWSESDQRALESSASIIGELVKSTDSRGNRLRVESAYLGLSEALQRLRSPEEVKEAVVEVLGHALGASRVIVVEFNDSGQTTPVTQEYRQPSAKSALGATFGESLVSRVASSGGSQPIVIDGSDEPSLMGTERAAELDVKSELAVPLRVDGKTEAIVYVHQCDRVREWEHEEIEFAERVARQLSLSLSNLHSHEQALSDAQQARGEARRASEARSRAEGLLASLPEMVIGVDREGKVDFFNTAASVMRGLTREDLGRPAESLTNEDNPIWKKIAVSENVTRFDTEMQTTSAVNGDTKPVSISAAPLRNQKGEITGRLIVVSDLSHVKSGAASQRIQELEQKLQSIERVLGHSRDMEEQARAMLAEASALEKKARAEADHSRQVEEEIRNQLAKVRDEHKQVQSSSQQLLEINKLKSEFIVNAGHEIEASLQSVLGLAELLERGSYGELTKEQREAVHSLYGWGRRIKGDVDWLVEYGSTRTRRLESSGGSYE